MNTIIVLTETPVWHQGYIKHHLRNPGINMTGSFKGNRFVVNDIYEILFINPVGIYSDAEFFANCILDLTDGKYKKMPLAKQMLIGALVITTLEFTCGCIVNLWLGWHVWDYSNMPFNLLGQICLPFTAIWFFLSAVAVVLDDYIRHLLWGEKIPHYKLF